MPARFVDGVVVEIVGDDIVILDSVHHTVHTFPSSYLDTVDALSQGKKVANFNHVVELANLGLVTRGSGGVSRRAVLMGAGAVGVSLALPTAAVAASGGLFVGNTVFRWRRPDSFDIFSDGPLPADVFINGSSWTLTIGGDSGTAIVSSSQLIFVTFGLTPSPGDVLFGRLSGPNGELSNLFEIGEENAG